ncbi:hypothetical protein Tco_0177949 [Tanacetum coccineum]
MVLNTFFDVLEHYFWKWQRSAKPSRAARGEICGKDGGDSVKNVIKRKEDVFSWLDEVSLVDEVFDGAFGRVGDEEVVVEEDVPWEEEA